MEPARAGVRHAGVRQGEGRGGLCRANQPRKPVDKYKEITMPSGRVIRHYSQISDETWARHFACTGGPVGYSISSTRKESSGTAVAADGQDQPQAGPTAEAKPLPSSKKR
jgi:hypothetical protein